MLARVFFDMCNHLDQNSLKLGIVHDQGSAWLTCADSAHCESRNSERLNGTFLRASLGSCGF